MNVTKNFTIFEHYKDYLILRLHFFRQTPNKDIIGLCHESKTSLSFSELPIVYSTLLSCVLRYTKMVTKSAVLK